MGVRRLERMVLGVATGVSLVVFLAAVGLWARVRFGGEWESGWGDVAAGAGYRLSASQEGVTLRRHTDGWPKPAATQPAVIGVEVLPGGWTFAGTHLVRYAMVPRTPDRKRRPGVYANTTEFGVAFATLLAAALLPAAAVVRGVRRRRRSRVERRRLAGLCAGCGYDLRATPGRCPECGRVPA